jgi:streptomycin 6-kinase
MIDDYLARWGLVRDGEPILTHSSVLQPVRFEGAPAMLKIALSEEEQRGNDLMVWWAGRGPARVLARGTHALLMERAIGDGSLAAMARNGRDGEAARIICKVTGTLHSVPGSAPCRLVTLQEWFRDLAPAARRYGGMLVPAAAAAQDMLASQEKLVALHGDIHHGNILDFGAGD